MRWLRALRRNILGFGVLLPFVVLASMAQALVVGPLLGNDTFIPRQIYNATRRLLGIRFEFNGVALEKDRQALFVSNHISRADFVIGSFLPNSSFVMNAKFFGWPGVGLLAKAAKIIGTRQKQETKAQDRAALIKAFNEGGHNICMFPEGIQTPGKEVLQFSAGLADIMFGEAGQGRKGNPVYLEKDVVIQPIAMRVKEIEGRNVIDDPAAWEPYTMIDDYRDLLKRIWNRTMVRDITIEITVFDPLDPKDFGDARGIMNAAHDRIKSVVAPHQEGVRRRREYLEEWDRKRDQALGLQ